MTEGYLDYLASPATSATRRRIYDERAMYERIVEPSGLTLVEPVDFKRSDWNDWPIKTQAPSVYEKGVNIQVAFVLLRKA